MCKAKCDIQYVVPVAVGGSVPIANCDIVPVTVRS
jgi:hypothetical protein